MEYLTQKEVAMIFERWLKRRVLKIKKSTKFNSTFNLVLDIIGQIREKVQSG